MVTSRFVLDDTTVIVDEEKYVVHYDAVTKVFDSIARRSEAIELLVSLHGDNQFFDYMVDHAITGDLLEIFYPKAFWVGEAYSGFYVDISTSETLEVYWDTDYYYFKRFSDSGNIEVGGKTKAELISRVYNALRIDLETTRNLCKSLLEESNRLAYLQNRIHSWAKQQGGGT